MSAKSDWGKSDRFRSGGTLCDALFELAREAMPSIGDREIWRKFPALLVESPEELNRLVRSPVFTANAKAKAIAAVARRRRDRRGIAANLLKAVSPATGGCSGRRQSSRDSAPWWPPQGRGERRGDGGRNRVGSTPRRGEATRSTRSPKRTRMVDVKVEPSTHGGLISETRQPPHGRQFASHQLHALTSREKEVGLMEHPRRRNLIDSSRSRSGISAVGPRSRKSGQVLSSATARQGLRPRPTCRRRMVESRNGIAAWRFKPRDRQLSAS